MSDQHNTTNIPYEQPAREESTPRRPRKRKRRRFSPILTFFKIIGTLILIGITTGALLCCFGAVYIQTVIMPLVEEFSTESFILGENSVMYYSDPDTGEYKELVTLLTTTSSIWTNYEDLPEDLINATIAIEDQRFYTHKGVDWIRTGYAVLTMFTGGDVQGGSTLTQQVIKNMTGYDDVTVKRKIVEIFTALSMDAQYSKQDIITWYLNIIYLGESCDGVGSASYKYFGKDVTELSLAECASLISITNNPSIYSPYGTLKVTDEETGEVMTSRDYNKQRQETVLWCMWQQGMITEEEYEDACAEELVFVRAEGESADTTIYSWYEELVISDVRADLMSTYGYSTEAANALLSSGGLSIYTCVDLEIQAIAEEIYFNRDNLDYSSATSGQDLQSAITIIDNESGDVVAVVGRVEEKNQNLLRNLATDAVNQPGSAIKPLSVYAPALEMGMLTPYTVLDDYPYMLLNDSAWPNNVDFKFRGLVTVEAAVANSYNTVAVKVLGDMVTPQESFNFMENRFHIDLVDAREYNGLIYSDIDLAPLSMGGLTDGVNTRDMAEAYATFPNNGIYQYSRTYTQVLDSSGKVLLDNTPQEEAILKDTTAYYMTSMLKQVVAYGSATVAQMDNMAVAGKTGTTNSMYDRWFVGYTPYYTAAVWVGYEYDEAIDAHYTVATQMWANVMNPIHEDLEYADFYTPSGITSYSYCLDSGLRATEYCELDPRGSRVATGYLLSEDIPSQFCTCHTADTVLTICVDDPVKDEIEAHTGQFYLATDNCIALSLRTYSYPNYDRVLITNSSGYTTTANDEIYLYRNNFGLESCHIHGTTVTLPTTPMDTNGDGIVDYYPSDGTSAWGVDLTGDGYVDLYFTTDPSLGADTNGDGIPDYFPLAGVNTDTSTDTSTGTSTGTTEPEVTPEVEEESSGGSIFDWFF